MAIKITDLTTAQRIADYGGLGTLTGTKLTVMNRIVTQLSGFVLRYIGRNLKQATYTQEEYSTEHGNSLNLQNFPISSSATFKLELRTSGENEDEWETVDSQYYFIDYDSGIIFGISGWNFMRTVNGYRVTYTAGYDFDNTTKFLSDTDAADIELVVWMLGMSVWNRRKGGVGIRSEKIGDYSVSYTKMLLENSDIKSILDKYKNQGNDNLGAMTPIQP